MRGQVAAIALHTGPWERCSGEVLMTMWMASILQVLALGAVDPAAPLAASAAPAPIYWRQTLFSIPFHVERPDPARPGTRAGPVVRLSRPGSALGQLAASQAGKRVFPLQGWRRRRILVRRAHARPFRSGSTARSSYAQVDRDRRHGSAQGAAYGRSRRCRTDHSRLPHGGALSQTR